MGDTANSDGVEAPRPISAGRNALGGYPCVGDVWTDPAANWGACGAEAEFVVGAELDFGMVRLSACMRHLLSVSRFLEFQALTAAEIERVDDLEDGADQVNAWQIQRIEDAG